MRQQERICLKHGDCLEIMKQIPDNTVDLVLTDPPYGTTNCKWDNVIAFEPMWEQINRIVKQNGAVCLFGCEPFSSYLRISNIRHFKYDWIWEKPQGTNPLSAKKQPLNNIEVISVFYKKQPTYNPQFESGKKYHIIRDKSERISEVYRHTFRKTEMINNGYRYPKRVLKYARQNGNHPTQKPTMLLEYLIRTYTNEGEVVLDFTMGSGSTGVACVNCGRRFIGVELDDKYFEIAKQRINDAVFSCK